METLTTYRRFIHVVLPLALPKLYTYAVPQNLEDKIVIGGRVEVQFGRQKLYTAIVHSIHSQAPQEYVPKEIISVVDEQPIVTAIQLRFWEWIATYYMCTLGEVMQAALPASFKLDSETYFTKNPGSDIDILDLPEDEYMIAEALNHQEEISLKDVSLILQKKSISKPVKSLLEKKVIYVKETLHEKYTPRKESFVALSEGFTENGMPTKRAFDLVEKYPKQEAVLLAFIGLSKNGNAIKKAELAKHAQATPAVIDSIVKKGIFEVGQRQVDRIQRSGSDSLSDVTLSNDQQNALKEVKEFYKEKEVVLLHGVTSSGKTLLYIELIKEQIAKGRQVLYLLPEISLTSQLIQRLEKVLGNIGVYHSKFSNAERVEIWNHVLSGETKIIIGARSSVFLPFKDLGLVIIDEEHDPSYKQFDPAPRYQCRDAAVFLATQFGAKVLLGSATPSIESYSNARSGKYGLVKLFSRYGDIALPEIEFVSLAEANKNRTVTSGITFLLRDEIQLALQNKEQVILFQNRRGYAPYISCSACNWIPMCRNCDVTLTYHKFTNDLRCHYCGYTQSLVNTCKACGSPAMEQKGLGTERIEEDLKVMFPDAKIGRMDYDTVRTKRGHDKIIAAFEDGEFDILVGTQMVTKGLDFGNVRLVGVLNADALLYYPDFRAFERAYQLLVQVSGRAGRRDTRGKVMIQIGKVDHPMVSFILNKEYEDLFTEMMLERQQFHYPPFTRLIELTVKHKEIKTTIEAANRIAQSLQSSYEGFVVGPNAPIIQKINNFYLRDILVKIPKNYKELNKVKWDIAKVIEDLYQFQAFRQVKVVIDVDTY